ncbi:hypothetical protein [Klebsiella pneumoniae]|uniref:hypothetical protein n=1 Tax=Klebsiella pneumoniae TaxID=573 RepID=UPI0018A31A84|nr:hypothetical protein [Klebsiella pneumoniae]MBF7746001.1 hypothetical protein [Klebsiella pneumoniae]MBF7761839.1 hypothetical protein [Klebsiella pneumoniae]MBF7767521.1 hypothetical protein [Klebsiella pneumoniae]MBF7815102.1 hypothetical protein [Klebsiella pneumoniae]MBF7850601.1 hypothetical protein [Klebsiella pneumoniae]
MTKISERGMIFNAEMMRALLDGRKTQTRRTVKPQPDEDGLAKVTNGPWVDTSERNYRCPFGAAGDRIWVRETWAEAGASAPDLKLYRANYPEHVPSIYENVPPAEEIRWTPSIHMPRTASRILLEITDVRVERLNAISEEDAEAEGIDMEALYDSQDCYDCIANHNMTGRPTVTGAFKYLWESIYGEEGWKSNPWVWVIKFKRIEELTA